MSILPIVPINAPSEAWPRRPCLVSVPGEHVSALICPVPANLKPAAARSIAVNAARDLVAGPPEAQHFVPVNGSGTTRTVLVTSRADLDAWSSILAQRKARSSAVLPDYLCLGWSEGCVSVDAPDADRLVVRSGEFAGFSGERALVLQMLELLRQRQAAETRDILITARAAEGDDDLTKALASWGRPIITSEATPNPPSVNLLTRGAGGVSLDGKARARLALVAAGVASLAIWTVSAQIDLTRDRADLDRQRSANQELARSAFGLTGPIIDMQVQVDRAMRGLKETAQDSGDRLGFPELLTRAGPVVAAPDVTVSELHYQNATLRVTVRVADFAALETLRSQLERDGVNAAITRSVGGGSAGVRAELLISDVRGAPG